MYNRKNKVKYILNKKIERIFNYRYILHDFLSRKKEEKGYEETF